MVDNFFRKKLFFLGFLIPVVFGASLVFAANPTNFLSPTGNILDPGAVNTPWGGCGPFDANCYTARKISNSVNSSQPPTGIINRAPTQTVSAVSNQAVLSALRNLLASGLPTDLLAKLRGPAGPAGPKGDSGITTVINTSTNLPSVSLPGAVIPPNPTTYYPGGSLFSATDLSSTNFITTTAKIVTLTVSGNTTFTGDLSVGGTLASVGNSTLATGASTTNTFGSGASSANTIGSTTTPGTLTLHGATTLDNTFSQTGANTFGTGTGAISLNGAVTVTGANTFTTGTGTVEFKNVSTNISSTNPVIDVTSASTLFINSVTNRPVSFGTGLVTANNFGSSSVAITGGTITGTTINNSTIGVTTPVAGNFTTIGVTTPGSATFTTITSSGNSTLATGTSTTNTFGSGASSANTIGSTTTPGTLTLHGATTLDNTFSQTGANTFGTGTGAVTLNGQTEIKKNLTIPVTTGSTVGVIYSGADRFIHTYAKTGSEGQNTFVGVNAGNFTMGPPTGGDPTDMGSFNTAIGYQSLTSNTTGAYNSALGFRALAGNTEGNFNSAVGYLTMNDNTTGSSNSTLGYSALQYNTTGSYNVALGYLAGRLIANGGDLTDPENSIYIGYGARAFSNADDNSIVIGFNAVGIGANTVVLGNDSILTTALKGNVTIPANKNLTMTSGTGQFSTGTGAISLNGAVTVTGANTFTTGTGTVEFKNVSTNISSTNPVIDVTSASTLFINSVTNRPVSFGTGLVTANNFGSSSVAITGGTIVGTTINNSTIGVTTPGSATFTTITSSGNSTLATGTGTTNTFGSGASSANTIGSTTTPGTLTLHGATTLDNTFSQTGANTFSTGTGAISLNGAVTVTGANTFATGTGTVTLNNVSTNISSSSPVIDLTTATTLSVNTVTNRPVTFGTGTVTIPSLSVTNGQSSAGTFSIDSNATTQTIFSVTGAAITSGTAIAKTITANAGNGQLSKGEILNLTDSTTAGGGFTGIGITVTGAGTGLGNKYLLLLNPNVANNEVVFDNTGSFRPTASSDSNTNTIGSSAYKWKNGYFDQITANSLAGTVITGSTSSTIWTIGSTQAGDINESLVFQRMNGSGSAVLQWNAGAGNVRYLSTNYPFNTTYTVEDLSPIGTSINLLSGDLVNNTSSGTQKLLSLVNTGTGTTENGIYIGNTGTGTTALEIAGTWTNGIITNNNSINAGTGTVTAATFSGNLTGNVTGNVSGNAGTVTGLSVTAGKTLTVSDSTTLATNAITLAGGEVITFSPTNALSLLTTAGTSVTLPTSGTLATLAGTETFTNKTLTSPKINEDVALTTTSTKLNYLTSAGGTTGTTSTNLVFSTSPVLTTPTLGVASATSLATSAAIPFLLTNGQLVNVALTSQTIGATTLTIPDFAGVVDEFTFKTKSQTLSNKTFVAPVLGAATATTINGLTITSTAGTLTIPNNASAVLALSGNYSTTLTATNTTSVTLPTSGTLATLAGTETFTNKTLTSPKINEDVALTTTSTKLNYLTSAGGTTGTTSTNLVFSTSPVLTTPTLGVASATSLATSAAIPFLLTNGQLVNVALTSQTIGATTLTIPDFAGVVDEFTFKTKSQTLSNKTFVAPVLGAATGTSLSLSGNISATSWTTTGIAFNTTAATYTDTSTAGAGTVAIRTANSFSAPTFASTNAITVTNGFSLYVPKPIAGVNTTLTNANSAYFEGSVGINTTAPARKLDILDVNDVAQIRLTQTAATTYSELQTNSAGDLILSASGGDVRLQEGNLWVCSGGSCANADPAEHGNIIVETSVLLNNGFRLKQTGASTVDMYDSSGTNIILEFDEAQ